MDSSKKSTLLRVAAQLSWALMLAAVGATITAAHAASGERIIFKSGELSLVGYLYRPVGAGPWPALIWNHGSERNPDRTRQYDPIADIFVPGPEREQSHCFGGAVGMHVWAEDAKAFLAEQLAKP